MPGKFIKGALIEFMPTALIPLPNVIVFQFNPETIQRTFTQPAPAGAGSGDASQPNSNPLAVQGMPGESFELTLTMDANDSVASGAPISGPIAEATGLYTRIAALEMLLYPHGADLSLFGSVSLSVGAGGVSADAGAGAEARRIPQMEVPVVLFVWGMFRIVPVRLTSLSITEKLYDSLLRPTQAEARVGLRVLTPQELSAASGQPLADLAKIAYEYTQILRQGFAVANLANAAESFAMSLPL